MKRVLWSFMAVVGGFAVADTVVLKNGSIINGDIITIYQEKMVVKTDFSDDLSIDMGKVKSYQTDADVKVELESGTTLVGTVNSSEENTKITSKTDELKLNSEIKPKSVKMLWPKGDDAPNYKPPFKKVWSTTLAASYVKKSGNTEETEYHLSLESILKGEMDTTKLFVRYQNTSKSGERTNDEVIAGVDYEHRFKGVSNVYARAEVERDPFEDIDLRLQIAAGYGRYFINKERLKLRARLGVFFRHEAFSSTRAPINSWGPDLGLRLDYASLNDWSMYSDLSYTPTVEHFQNCLIKHESAFVAPIKGTDWSLKLGVRHEYNSNSSAGKKDLDTTYFTNLQLKF